MRGGTGRPYARSAECDAMGLERDEAEFTLLPRVRTLGHVHTSPHRKVSEREERSIETETK